MWSTFQPAVPIGRNRSPDGVADDIELELADALVLELGRERRVRVREVDRVRVDAEVRS